MLKIVNFTYVWKNEIFKYNNKHCLKKYLPICDEMTEDSDYVDKVITKMDPAALI